VIIDILSLFPDYFKGPFDESILKRARESGLIDIHHVNIRDFAEDTHRRVDDRPFGGGPGMVLMPGPTLAAIRSVKKPMSRVIYLSPQGPVLTAEKCRALAAEKHLVLLCGHYEGLDQRVLDIGVDEEISIGDYVLTNGCLAAIVLIDAMVRFIPGVLGHADAAAEDSFENGLLDCPHYTRPRVYEDPLTKQSYEVPSVLLNGNHQEIARWRAVESWAKTERVRKDLIDKRTRAQKSQ